MTSQAATVGVVIPTCARPTLLAEALASVNAQTTSPTRIVVVNDHPATFDEAANICRAAGAECIAGEAAGASAARNAGAARLDTEFVAFLDDDDLWEPAFLQTCLDEALRVDVGLVFAAAQVVDAEGRRIETLAPAAGRDFFADRASNPGITGSTMLIRRSLFEEVGGFDRHLLVCNDKDLAYRLAEAATFAVVTEPLVRFRHHDIGPRLTTSHQPGRLASLERYAAKHGAVAGRRARARMQLSVLRERWHLEPHAARRTAIAVEVSLLALRAGPWGILVDRVRRRTRRSRASRPDQVSMTA